MTFLEQVKFAPAY